MGVVNAQTAAHVDHHWDVSAERQVASMPSGTCSPILWSRIGSSLRFLEGFGEKKSGIC